MHDLRVNDFPVGSNCRFDRDRPSDTRRLRNGGVDRLEVLDFFWCPDLAPDADRRYLGPRPGRGSIGLLFGRDSIGILLAGDSIGRRLVAWPRSLVCSTPGLRSAQAR